MALDTYGHVFAELEGAEKVSAEAEIRRARDESVPVSYLEEPAPDEGDHKTPANLRAQRRTQTGDPYLTMERLRQLVASHGNGFRLCEPFWGASHCHD